MRQAIIFFLLSQFFLPQMGNPQMDYQQMGNPQMSNPQMGYPQMSDPQMSNPQMGYPQMSDPQMGDPQMGYQQMGNPQMGYPQMGDPRMGQMGNPQMHGPSMDPSNGPKDQTEDLEDLTYKNLSPGAFFGMKENENAPLGLGFGLDSGMAPAVGAAVGLLSPEKNGPLGYEHFDLQTLSAMSRQQEKLQENYALIATIEDDKKRTDELIIYNLCFSLSYIFRRGRQSIRKYFNLRDIYSNHLAFEVGYITHVISIRYQNMLELYQYSSSLVGSGDKIKISRIHMVHFHHSITEDSRTVVHLCNMLHELQRKYAVRPYDPSNKFDLPGDHHVDAVTEETNSEKPEDSDREGRQGRDMPKIDKAYLAKRIELSHKLINEALAKRKLKLQQAKTFFQKHGHMPSTRQTQRPMRCVQ